MPEWLRFGLFALLLALGVMFEACAVLGVNRFKYSLNRLHAAAVGDTLGILSVILASLVYAGADFLSLKLILVIALMWAANPVSGHLIGLMALKTDSKLRKEAKPWRN